MRPLTNNSKRFIHQFGEHRRISATKSKIGGTDKREVILIHEPNTKHGATREFKRGRACLEQIEITHPRSSYHLVISIVEEA